MFRENDQLVSYLSRADVDIVIARVPGQFRMRLRDVYFSRLSHGVRRLGSVRRRGRRDITMYSVLPPRLSLRGYIRSGQAASEFGAPSSGQWPPWAVRRFLLYDVLLHELGHIQVVDAKGSDFRRKYAGETLAQRFADDLRRELWCEPFEHPDPVHNPPSDAEFSVLALWQQADKQKRGLLVSLALSAPHPKLPALDDFRPLSPVQTRFFQQALCHHGSK